MLRSERVDTWIDVDILCNRNEKFLLTENDVLDGDIFVVLSLGKHREVSVTKGCVDKKGLRLFFGNLDICHCAECEDG